MWLLFPATNSPPFRQILLPYGFTIFLAMFTVDKIQSYSQDLLIQLHDGVLHVVSFLCHMKFSMW